MTESVEVVASEVEDNRPDRLLQLSDGVFSIAMTLLVLNISIPAGLNAARYEHALRALGPQLAAYGLSFVIIAAFWRDNRRIFQRVQRTDEVLQRLALVTLGLVAVLPFPTSLLAEYGSRAPSVAIYAGAVAAADALHLAMLVYLWLHPGLLRAPIPTPIAKNRIVDLGVTVVVFAVSIPVAFGSTSVALWSWVTLVPLKFAIGRHRLRKQVELQASGAEGAEGAAEGR